MFSVRSSSPAKIWSTWLMVVTGSKPYTLLTCLLLKLIHFFKLPKMPKFYPCVLIGDKVGLAELNFFLGLRFDLTKFLVNILFSFPDFNF